MRRILLLLVLLMFVGAASATDYYVATWGDNTTQGNITHPWQNVSYATQQAVAGDTIYLFNGTWYNETCTFANSGNATHQITLTSYNGTPIFDGINRSTMCIYASGKSYINIVGPMLIKNHSAATAFANATHINISNIEADGGWNGVEGSGVSLIENGLDVHNITISDCVFHDPGHDCVTFYGNREPPEGSGVPSTNFTIRNCTIYNCIKHDAIDMDGNVQYAVIENNEFYNNPAGCLYDHAYADHREHVVIRDNHFHDTQSKAIDIHRDSYYEIYNNTFENILYNYPIYIYANEYGVCHDFKIYNNSFYNCSRIRVNAGYNFILDRNYMYTDCAGYEFAYGSAYTNGSNSTVRNPLGIKEIELWENQNGTVTLEFDDGTVFTASPYGGYSSWAPVRHYPDRSNCSMKQMAGDEGARIEYITTYNITLRPTYAYLCNVTVDHESDASDDHTNISVNSTESENPTWINATMQNASANYSISVDGSIVDYIIADSDGIVKYHYTSSWSPHDFEFNWVDQGDFSPDHSKAYYNLSSPIENTVNSTGYHFYNKTLGWGDTKTISFKLVVTT